MILFQDIAGLVCSVEVCVEVEEAMAKIRMDMP